MLASLSTTTYFRRLTIEKGKNNLCPRRQEEKNGFFCNIYMITNSDYQNQEMIKNESHPSNKCSERSETWNYNKTDTPTETDRFTNQPTDNVHEPDYTLACITELHNYLWILLELYNLVLRLNFRICMCIKIMAD